MNILNNASQTPSNMPTEQVESQTPAMTKPAEDPQEISPGTKAWLGSVVTRLSRLFFCGMLRSLCTR